MRGGATTAIIIIDYIKCHDGISAPHPPCLAFTKMERLDLEAVSAECGPGCGGRGHSLILCVILIATEDSLLWQNIVFE